MFVVSLQLVEAIYFKSECLTEKSLIISDLSVKLVIAHRTIADDCFETGIAPREIEGFACSTTGQLVGLHNYLMKKITTINFS